jgi:SAM-dependent methyltransferase
MLGEYFLIKRKVTNLIGNALKDKNSKILDLGCGECPYYHKKVSGKIVCADLILTKTAHIVSDADKLPFKPNSFDTVLSVNSFYYFKNPFNVVKQLHKLLKRDGKLILMLPFFYPIHDVPVDKYRFTEYGLKTVLNDEFKIEKISTIGGFFNLPAVILHALMKGLPLISTKPIRPIMKLISYAIWPFYIIAQLISLLGFLDKTKRFPTYYFVIAKKK